MHNTVLAFPYGTGLVNIAHRNHGVALKYIINYVRTFVCRRVRVVFLSIYRGIYHNTRTRRSIFTQILVYRSL